ncbi:response regulator [Streptomyces luteolifulvus]|jgi:PAS domain S-box-containing protein|uniref:Circadian input-output histidine kinase CikA n=1 Tax=Streptomyces luteolifulvus TaxID=2615112 RepID=A0A6H9VAJ4_9ACTN|nr:response regulator [Streptomyces luteolifulvus]KAB1150054.1 response regulator [Streptomyces luteolifulvus]
MAPSDPPRQYAADDEERFRLLEKNSPDMVFRRTVDGVYLEVSAAGALLLGRPVEQIVGTSAESWVHPGDAEEFEWAERDLRRDGRVVVCLRLRHADGHWMWVEDTCWVVRDAAGEPQEVRGFLREAEGQRRREEALRLLQEQARSVIDTARDAFVSIDEDGLVIDWNQSAERLFGYSHREVMGRPLADTLIPERYRSAHLAGLARVLSGGESHVLGRRIELSALHRDGHEIPVELAVWRLKSAKARCFNAFLRDITERKQTEVALAQARDQAIAASQAKSQFVASMSHEIRTPMNGVIGLSNLLLGTELDPEQRRYAEGIQSAGSALLSLINDILDFSKLEAGKLELEEVAFSPQLMVEEVIALVAQTAQARGLELLSDFHPQLPAMVLGDSGRLRQILLNLASNAVKFTESGEVVIRVRPASAQPSAQSAPWLHFEVTDTGIGIAEADQKRMFDAFSQADASTTRRYGGTGLGLAICRRLTEAMGGSIGVNSRSGEGSTFWFTVPVRTPDTPQPPQEAAQPVVLRGLRALIVDDNDTNRLILDTQLRRWHMHTTTVAGGPQALVALHEAAAAGRLFDLALLDMQMPDMDGLELARRITTDQKLGRVPLVLLTSGPPLPAAELTAAGIARSLAKPVQQSQLMDALTEIVTHRSPAAAATPAPAERPPAHRGHLLLVEDNDINQMVAQGILTRLGYSADVAADGLQALQLLGEHPYQAVLMDCHMPRMDGYSATRELRRRERNSGRHVPVIAMTADALAEDRDRCLAAGMDDYISKPVSAEELEHALVRWAHPAGPAADEDDLRISIEQRLDELRGSGTPAENDLVDRLVDHFLTRAPELTSALFHALDRHDSSEIAEKAHSLKGAAGNIGAQSLADCCQDLEQAARGGAPTQLAETAPRLQAELDRTCRTIETLRSRPPGRGRDED